MSNDIQNLPNKEDTGVFTEEELNVLKDNDTIRKKLIDNLLSSGELPTKVGDLRVLNELLGSRDNVVKLKSDARLKKADTGNKGQIIDIVEHLLKSINNRTTDDVAGIKYVDEVIDEAEFVYGEKEIQPDQLSLDQFTLKE